MTHRHMVLNPNTLDLKFTEADWLENFVLNEIEKDYGFDYLNLQPGDQVLDVGACTGVVSMYIAKKYGCHVRAYEPAPRNFRLLCNNVVANELQSKIEVFNLALTRDGRDVYIGNNPLNWGGNNIYGGEGDLVHSTTLEREIQGPIALLKIDAEQAEFEILEDLEPLKQVRSLRGEFHGHKQGDIEGLFAHVSQVIPDCQPIMHHSWAMRYAQMQLQRNRG